MKIHNISLDKFNIKYKAVKPTVFYQLIELLEKLFKAGMIPHEPMAVSGVKSGYRESWVVKTDDESTIFIGWSSYGQSAVDQAAIMKVEFNPNKSNDIQESVLKIIRLMVCEYREVMLQIDLALDLEIPNNAIYSIPLKGRESNKHKSTRYWGEMGTDRYMRLYDKKKEREQKGVAVGAEYLTRLEWQLIPDKKGLSFKEWNEYRPDIDSIYAIGLMESVPFDMRMMFAGLMNTDFNLAMKDYRKHDESGYKRLQRQIKKSRAPLNPIVNEKWFDLMESIKHYFNYPEWTENEIVFDGADESKETPENAKKKRMAYRKRKGELMKQRSELIQGIENTLNIKVKSEHKKSLSNFGESR